MKPSVQSALHAELTFFRAAAAAGEHARAWSHLERAHILSQAYAWPHVYVHARMLHAAWQRRDLREVVGQLIRIVLAAPGSWLNRAPLGNTGGADVGMLTPMPIFADLQRILTA